VPAARPVLVTGASGFVGRFMIDALQEQGFEVCALGSTERPDWLTGDVAWAQVDLRDPGQLAAAIPRQWWAVVHLAAQSVPSAFASPSALLDNVAMTVSLLEHVTEGRVLFASSCHVYAPSRSPVGEVSPTHPRGRYGLSKLLCEQAMLAKADRLMVRIARPFNHIGPGMQPSLAIPELLSRVLKEQGTRTPLLLRGLNSTRDFVDVRDIVRAYLSMLQMDGDSGRVFNVCSGVPVSIGALAREVLALAGEAREVEFAERVNSSDDTAFLVGDGTRLRQETGWAPRHSLRESVAFALASLRPPT
jgi:GDP-4-dehydro-6-deoxy-D-mannose reductase